MESPADEEPLIDLLVAYQARKREAFARLYAALAPGVRNAPPELSGLELQKQLAGRPDVPIIFMTSHSDVPMTVQVMKAGAIEFLTKPINGAALLHAIATAVEQSRGALRHVAATRALQTRYSTLTPRERDVMALVASGLLNMQVGFELGIGEVTVKAHRAEVMRKMEAESLPNLVTMAMRLGLPSVATH